MPVVDDAPVSRSSSSRRSARRSPAAAPCRRTSRGRGRFSRPAISRTPSASWRPRCERAGLLSGRSRCRLRRARAEGREVGARAVRSRARARPARLCVGARRTRSGAAGAGSRRRRGRGVRSGARRRSVADRSAAPGRSAEVPRPRAGPGRARDAARAGRSTRRSSAYAAAIASSPDSAFLYRELGAVERSAGDADDALEHFRKAVELDPTDAGTLGADWRAARSQRRCRRGARRPTTQALAIEPSAAVEAQRDALARARSWPGSRSEYRAIESAPQITRGAIWRR